MSGGWDLNCQHFGPKNSSQIHPMHHQCAPFTGVGTYRYMAPEVVRYEQYTVRETQGFLGKTKQERLKTLRLCLISRVYHVRTHRYVSISTETSTTEPSYLKTLKASFFVGCLSRTAYQASQVLEGGFHQWTDGQWVRSYKSLSRKSRFISWPWNPQQSWKLETIQRCWKSLTVFSTSWKWKMVFFGDKLNSSSFWSHFPLNHDYDRKSTLLGGGNKWRTCAEDKIDVYAMALIMYYILSGENMVQGKNIALLHRFLFEVWNFAWWWITLQQAFPCCIPGY